MDVQRPACDWRVVSKNGQREYLLVEGHVAIAEVRREDEVWILAWGEINDDGDYSYEWGHVYLNDVLRFAAVNLDAIRGGRDVG